MHILRTQLKNEGIKHIFCYYSWGLRYILHLLDVSINKPFTDYRRKLNTEWMVLDGKHSFTKTEKVQRQSTGTLVSWIFNFILSDTVKKSFKETNIFCAIHGSENHLIYVDDDDDDIINDEDNN